jgi:hypothetical protein
MIWFHKPRLERDDQIEWSAAANRDQGGRAIGGKLFLSKRGLYFQPHTFDIVTGGRAWNCHRQEIKDIEKSKGDGNPYSGGMRDRFQVELRDGSQEKFVVRRLDETIEDLVDRLSAR